VARRKGKVREYVEAFAIALLLALFLRTTVVQARIIPSGSMEDTLLVGDYLFVNKFVYGYHLPFTKGRILAVRAPARGDIVVFDPPFESASPFIKRVIAVPGETIEIRERKVFIDGRPLREDYARFAGGPAPDRFLPRRDDLPPLKVPPDKFFVMGDNRDHSYDSRFWGFVDLDDVIGEAMVIGASVELDRHIPWYEAWRYPELVRWGRIGKVLH
jgi:signal peptidase I